MTDTKFPRPPKVFKSVPALTFYPDEVDDWFKRCIAEFPYADPYGDDTSDPLFLKLIRDRHIWFIKWFGQFKEDSQ